MGIANLNKFLRKNCPHVFRRIHLDEIGTLRATIDTSLYIFKYKTVFGDSWKNAFLHFVVCLRKNNIHACFIYDTSSPKEKDLERNRRKDQKTKIDDKLTCLSVALEKAQLSGEIDPILIEFNNSFQVKKSLLLDPSHIPINLTTIAVELSKRRNRLISVTESDFTDSKELLTVLCIQWFHAAMEAETTCADMCINKKADVVFSDDTDVLCYGAPHVITKVNTGENTAVLVSHSEILESLDLTHEQFVDFCIMCGTDYNDNIPKIGPETAFKLIKKYKTIEGISASGIDVTILNHIRVRDLFLNYQKTDKQMIFCKSPEFKEVELFLTKNNITFNMSKIKKYFSKREFLIIE
jgi:5'-3' exonuclease